MVSIIIPVYNRETLIGKTLDSILEQTYTDWECWVVDDSSTDSTIEVVNGYVKRDTRVKLVRNQNIKGAPGARNTGLELSAGDYICFFDSDDIMYPTHLERKIAYSLEFPNCIITSFSHLKNDDDQVIAEFTHKTVGNIFGDLLAEKVYVDTNSALIKRTYFDKNIRWDESCPSYQEWDLHLQLSRRMEYIFVPEFLVGYYRRSKGTISSNPKNTLRGRWYVLLKYRNDFIEQWGIRAYQTRLSKLYADSMNCDFVFSDEFSLDHVDLEYIHAMKFSGDYGSVLHSIQRKLKSMLQKFKAIK